MSDPWKCCEYTKGAAYLLAPVLETLLALGITVLLMEEVQRDERADHASEDTDSDDDVDPLLDLCQSVHRFVPRAVRERVMVLDPLSALHCSDYLSMDADRLPRVTVDSLCNDP